MYCLGCVRSSKIRSQTGMRRLPLQPHEGREPPDVHIENKAKQTALALARTLPRKDILMLLSSGPSDTVPSEQRHPNNS